MINAALERDMDNVVAVVERARACRNLANIKKRQPLNTLYLLSDTEISNEGIDIIKDEINVKQVIKESDQSRFITYTLKPQLKTLGPKYGKLLPKISEYLKNGDGNAMVSLLNSGRNLEFELEGTKNLADARRRPDRLEAEGRFHFIG